MLMLQLQFDSIVHLGIDCRYTVMGEPNPTQLASHKDAHYGCAIKPLDSTFTPQLSSGLEMVLGQLTS
jgi:hypothetical protein